MIDLIFVLLMIVAVVKGFSKGLVIALFSIVAFVVGLAAALKLSATVAAYLQQSTSASGKWLPFISFILVFILVAFLVQLVAGIIDKTLEMAMLGWLNKIGGIIIYVLLYIFIYSIFLFYADKMELFSEETKLASRCYPWVQPWGPKVINAIAKAIPLFKDMFAQLEQFFEGLSHKMAH